jgi:hypothetical protein
MQGLAYLDLPPLAIFTPGRFGYSRHIALLNITSALRNYLNGKLVIAVCPSLEACCASNQRTRSSFIPSLEGAWGARKARSAQATHGGSLERSSHRCAYCTGAQDGEVHKAEDGVVWGRKVLAGLGENRDVSLRSPSWSLIVQRGRIIFPHSAVYLASTPGPLKAPTVRGDPKYMCSPMELRPQGRSFLAIVASLLVGSLIRFHCDAKPHSASRAHSRMISCCTWLITIFIQHMHTALRWDSEDVLTVHVQLPIGSEVHNSERRSRNTPH